jgi:hypothetical protein
MYSILFVLGPAVFIANEVAAGGRLPVTVPFGRAGSAILGIAGCVLGVAGIGLLFRLHFVTRLWPFALTPLVARILGVWLASLGLAHLWAAVDGDRRRARPLLLSSPITGVLLALVPLLHRSEVEHGVAAYLMLAAALVAVACVPESRAPTRSSSSGRRSLRPPPLSLL